MAGRSMRYAIASSSDSEYFLECFHPLSHFGTCARTVSFVINFCFFAFPPLSVFNYIFIYIVYACERMCVDVHMPCCAVVWRRENNFQESVFSFPHAGPRDKVHVVRHQASLALSHPSNPIADFLCAARVLLYIC